MHKLSKKTKFISCIHNHRNLIIVCMNYHKNLIIVCINYHKNLTIVCINYHKNLIIVCLNYHQNLIIVCINYHQNRRVDGPWSWVSHRQPNRRWDWQKNSVFPANKIVIWWSYICDQHQQCDDMSIIPLIFRFLTEDDMGKLKINVKGIFLNGANARDKIHS